MIIQSPKFTVQDHSFLNPFSGVLLNKLDDIERLAASSRWKRFRNDLLKYVSGIFFREIVYRLFKKGMFVTAKLFWDDTMKICLPASMDIFLLGCKTDPSEIRLARFIVKNLNKGDHFLDIGSHAGYYSLLSSYCAGEQGRVLSIEASPTSFTLLKNNISKKNNTDAFNIALSDEEGMTTFFEFPVIYSEYNTMESQQFEGREWFKRGKITKVPVKTMRGDSILEKSQLHPQIIKIDTEGSEYGVIKGLNNFLMQNNPFVVMEFVNKSRHNDNHILADSQLMQLGFAAFGIRQDGSLQRIEGATKDHVEATGLDSDNIVYKKNNF